MKRLIIFVIVFLIIYDCNSQNHNNEQYPTHLLNKSFSTYIIAIDSIKNHINKKDFNIVKNDYESIVNWAKSNGDMQLMYAFKLQKLKYIYSQDKNKSNYENKLNEILADVTKNNYKYLRVICLQQIANCNWEEKYYTKSLENYIYAYNEYSKYSLIEFPIKTEYLTEIGGKYYHFRDYETAKELFLEAFKEIPDLNKSNYISFINTIGLTYGYIGKADSSKYFLELALKIALNYKQEDWEGIIYGNLGDNYFKENKYDEALELFKKNIEISKRINNRLDLALTYSKYGALLLIKGDKKGALKAELQSLEIIHKKFNNYLVTYKIFPNVARAYAANGKYTEAFNYMDSALIAKEAYDKEKNSLLLKGVQHKIDIEKHNAAIKENENEIKNQKYFRNILVIGIIVLILLAILFYLQQSKIRKTQLKLLLSEKLATLGQVSAGVAHEVNTPLGAIKSSVEESLSSFPEILSEFLWLSKTLNEREKYLFLEFVALSVIKNESLTTKEERAIKKKINDKFDELGIANSRYLSGMLVQVGIYEVSDILEKLSSNQYFERLVILAYKILNIQRGNHTIHIAAEKATRIVYSLKTYLHSSSSKNMVAINLRDNIEIVLTIYNNRLKQGIKVIKNYDDIPEIYGHPDQLIQVWTNIIVNAVQAMDNTGALTINIIKQEDYVLVSIRDTGKGIPKKIQSRIFEPFFTTKASGEGSGVGLDVTKKILKEHSSEIWFESEEGKGTTFYVKLQIIQS